MLTFVGTKVERILLHAFKRASTNFWCWHDLFLCWDHLHQTRHLISEHLIHILDETRLQWLELLKIMYLQ